MTSDELKEKIKGFLATYRLEHVLTRDKVQRELVNLYHMATGRVVSCGGCVNSVKPVLAELTKVANMSADIQIKQPKPMEYLLKDKTRVFVSCLGLMVTPFNCTDNNARAMLGENPDLAARFDKLPDNWREESKKFYQTLLKPRDKARFEAKAEAVTIAKAPENDTPRAAQAVTVSEEPPTAQAVTSEPKTAKAERADKPKTNKPKGKKSKAKK